MAVIRTITATDIKMATPSIHPGSRSLLSSGKQHNNQNIQARSTSIDVCIFGWNVEWEHQRNEHNHQSHVLKYSIIIPLFYQCRPIHTSPSMLAILAAKSTLTGAVEFHFDQTQLDTVVTRRYRSVNPTSDQCANACITLRYHHFRSFAISYVLYSC
jgi:hypothetical protein